MDFFLSVPNTCDGIVQHTKVTPHHMMLSLLNLGVMMAVEDQTQTMCSPREILPSSTFNSLLLRVQQSISALVATIQSVSVIVTREFNATREDDYEVSV